MVKFPDDDNLLPVILHLIYSVKEVTYSQLSILFTLFQQMVKTLQNRQRQVSDVNVKLVSLDSCTCQIQVWVHFSAKVLLNWRDALDLESQLTEEEIMMRDSVRDYCQDKLMPRVLMANRHERKLRTRNRCFIK